MKDKDGFGHEKPNEGETNDWITPRWIIDVFDSLTSDGCFFDLDPCISVTQPWLTARKGYSIEQDGLKHEWWGTVWCNLPYGNKVKFWADKLVKHNNGIMLIFARIETKVWHDLLFPNASGFFVPNKRIIFCYPDGTPARNGKGNISSAGAPSIFVAFGDRCKDALLNIYDKQLMEGVFIPSIPKRRTDE